MPEAPAPPPSAPRRNYRVTALIVACAMFMEQMDGTVLATALPAMSRSFGADPLHMNVALTGYMLSLAVFIPASGRVADRFGSRTVFRTAIALFVAGSVLCGQAPNLGWLVAARIVQGMGGAMMVPVGRLLLLRSTPKSEMVSAVAWLLVPASIGPLAGPPLGGFLTTYLSWHWIFYINIPIGAIGLVLAGLFIDEVKEDAAAPLDLAGMAISGTALCGLTFGLEMAGRGVGSGPLWAGLLAVGGGAALLYARHARRHERPILDLRLLRVPTFANSVYGGTLFRVPVGAVPFLLPLMLQLGFGVSAARSGAITFATSAGTLLMRPFAKTILRRFGFRRVMVVNGVLAACTIGGYGAIRPGWPPAAAYALLLLGGFFQSLQFTAYNTIAYADLPNDRMSAGTSFYTTFQQLSLSLGITVAAAALGAARALAGHAQARPGDFTAAFAFVALFGLAAAPVARLLPGGAGAEISGHRG